MRIRQIKPDFHSDELCASWPADVRLLYIGLWQEADDGGWMEWRVPKLGADLFPYQARGRRERNIARWSQVLVQDKRLVIFDCGHAFIPHLTKHQKFGGRQVLTVMSAHARDCARTIADNRTGKVGKGIGTVGGGDGGESSNDAETIGDPLGLAIEQNRAIVADPDASDAVKRAARKFLMSVGVAA